VGEALRCAEEVDSADKGRRLVLLSVALLLEMRPRFRGGDGESRASSEETAMMVLRDCIGEVVAGVRKRLRLPPKAKEPITSASIQRFPGSSLLLEDLPLGSTFNFATPTLLNALRYTANSHRDFSLSAAGRAELEKRKFALLEGTRASHNISSSYVHCKMVAEEDMLASAAGEEAAGGGEQGQKPPSERAVAAGKDFDEAKNRLDRALPAIAAVLFPDLDARIAQSFAGSGHSATGMLSGAGLSVGAGAPKNVISKAPLGAGGRTGKRTRGDVEVLDVDEMPSTSSKTTSVSVNGGPSAKQAKVEDNPEAKRKKLLDVLLDAPLLSQSDRDLIALFAGGDNKIPHHPKYSSEAFLKAEEAAAAVAASSTPLEASPVDGMSSSAPLEPNPPPAPPPKFPGLPPGVSPKIQFELRLETPKVAGGIGGGGSGLNINRVFLELDYSSSSWRLYMKRKGKT